MKAVEELHAVNNSVQLSELCCVTRWVEARVGGRRRTGTVRAVNGRVSGSRGRHTSMATLGQHGGVAENAASCRPLNHGAQVRWKDPQSQPPEPVLRLNTQARTQKKHTSTLFILSWPALSCPAVPNHLASRARPPRRYNTHNCR